MPTPNISPENEAMLDNLVAHYQQNRGLYRRFLNAFHQQISDVIDPENGHPLSGLIHSVKFRLKDPTHLKRKLARKLLQATVAGTPFLYNTKNLFTTITDLAGYRILHLHTRQMGDINRHLLPLLEEAHKVVEGPEARTWNDESSEYFESVGIKTVRSPRMYSSVHYVVQPNTRAALTIEIQVRTLADEVWGEIDHQINYPEQHQSIACREQIRTLAFVTSSCSRLVDSIVRTHQDWVVTSGGDSPKE
jgi:putative GTP pyrophosphokinase